MQDINAIHSKFHTKNRNFDEYKFYNPYSEYKVKLGIKKESEIETSCDNFPDFTNYVDNFK